MFEVFTKKTGITVNTVYAQKGMLERLKNEGNNSLADLIFTVDIGRITNFKKAGLVQAIYSEALNANIPSNFRDPDGFWFGLTSRARVIVVSSERIKEGEISSYEELSQSKWKGRVCTRQGKHPYMAALTASVIAAHGSDQAKIWLTGLKNNLARRPQGNDRAQVKAIFSGICDVALINHYYLVKFQRKSSRNLQAFDVVIRKTVEHHQQLNSKHFHCDKHSHKPHSYNGLLQ